MLNLHTKLQCTILTTYPTKINIDDELRWKQNVYLLKLFVVMKMEKEQRNFPLAKWLPNNVGLLFVFNHIPWAPSWTLKATSHTS